MKGSGCQFKCVGEVRVGFRVKDLGFRASGWVEVCAMLVEVQSRL